jgi:hypothetical protein
MGAAEIIAQLPLLSAAELVEVQAKLGEFIGTGRAGAQPKPNVVYPGRIHSPRLAHHDQSKDFIKQIVEPTPDARL